MRRNLPHIATCLLVFEIVVQTVFAQANVSLKATVNRNKILIGEPVRVTLELKTPIGADISWFTQDSLAHFEFVEKGKIDSITNGDQRLLRQDILVTSFDSGTQVLPSLPIVVNGTTYLSDSIPIQVSFTKANSNADYNDIKDIVDIQNPYAKYIVWAVVAMTVISALLVFYFIRKKKLEGKLIKQIVPKLSPYEEAIKSLDELKKQNLPASGQTKLYYTRLNDVLRQFVLRKLKIASMVKTNEELILQLRQLNISPDEFSQLAQALRMSDFVKFAKYLPDENANEQNFSIIQSSVELLNKTEN
jgi:hypothetical protein